MAEPPPETAKRRRGRPAKSEHSPASTGGSTTRQGIDAVAQQADERVSALVRELRSALGEFTNRVETESTGDGWNDSLLQRYITRMRLALELPMEDLAELETAVRQRSRGRRGRT